MYFSVVVPIYNVKNYLDECIDGIIRQSFKDYEIILVDLSQEKSNVFDYYLSKNISMLMIALSQLDRVCQKKYYSFVGDNMAEKTNYYLSVVNDNRVRMEDVTENLEKIYSKMTTPIQILENLRYELEH